MLDNPLFAVKSHTLTLEQLWIHYEACLKSHDWNYEYSDDFRVWSNGRIQSDYIKHLVKVLSKHDEDKAKEMYNKYTMTEKMS